MLTAFHDAQLVKIRVDGREGGTLSLKPGSNLTIGRWVLVSSPTRPLPHLAPARTRCGSVQLFGCGPARGAGRESGRTRACACACVRGGRRVFAVLLPELPAADHFRFATTGPTNATCSLTSRCEGARLFATSRGVRCAVSRGAVGRVGRCWQPDPSSPHSGRRSPFFGSRPCHAPPINQRPIRPPPRLTRSCRGSTRRYSWMRTARFSSRAFRTTRPSLTGRASPRTRWCAPRHAPRAVRCAPCVVRAVRRAPCAVCRAPYPAATAPRRAVPCTAHRPPLTAYRSPLTQLPPHPPTHPPRHLRGTYCERCR